MRWVSGWAWRMGGAVGVVWLVGIALLAPSPQPTGRSSDPTLSLRLQRAVRDLQDLQKQNTDIRAILTEFSKQLTDVGGGAGQMGHLEEKLRLAQQLLSRVDNSHQSQAEVVQFIPSRELEVTRRRVERGHKEWFWYMDDQLRNLRGSLSAFPDHVARIDGMLENGAEHARVTSYDLQRLGSLDGLVVWREREAAELSALVQARLHALQHPPDCASARKLTCSINKGCGYGCQIHHVVYCFIMAYGTKRTLILKSQGWRYNRAGWEDVFRPLSDTCTDPNGGWRVHWPGNNNSQVLDLPIIDTLAHRPAFLPPAIPRDLADRLIRLHGNPSAWWIGQFLKYMLKPQPKLQQQLDDMTENIGFQKPIVGIHVRRTDKVGTEAAFHPLDEYMRHVEDYFLEQSLSNPGIVRRVYVASDDPNVLTDARAKYPNYKFFGDPNISKSAAVATRYSDSSLKGIIADIHFLSLTDYIVCTFSSQVCRIAYEIMQTLQPDASTKFRSLDDIFYYGGQGSHNQKARFDHNPKNSHTEMTMVKDDVIGIAGNHWNGYSKGTNKRTRQNALYPSYKAEDIVEVAECPTYEEVRLDSSEVRQRDDAETGKIGNKYLRDNRIT